jgi:sensor histidine kinase regulating citrate/malate metabolism
MIFLFLIPISILIIDIIYTCLTKKIEAKYISLFVSLEVISFIIVGFLEQSLHHLIIIVIPVVYVILRLLFLKLVKNDSIEVYDIHKKMMEKQANEVEQTYKSIRAFRHDYHNHIQKLKAHLELEQYDAASEYLKSMDKDITKTSAFTETGNVHIDAILNSKISLAKSNNIDINYKAKVPKDIPLSETDLCTLMGNLIDNAIESAMISDKKFIRIYIGKFKDQLYISISNSTNNTVKLNNDNLLTRKKGNHGYGIKSIEVIIYKYQGYLNRKNEPGVFVTEVTFPM